jgi:hypothetical protein
MKTPTASREWVPVILAVGLSTALNVIVAGILYDAIRNPSQAGISENATQILTGWGGGVIGILGAVFGYHAGAATRGGPASHGDNETGPPSSG